MVRSIPEKTFEHWSSMYVAHRFPRGGLWWPTQGEDIHVEDLGTLPGKSVLLETKVPEQAATGTHSVTVDLAQLNRYVSSLVPVYYVFPEPPWVGDLMASGWLGRERRADLAYKRAGHRWFGEWTLVCRAVDLQAHLAPAPGQQTATITTPPPQHWRWFDFWTELVRCGSRTMAAAFILPADDVGAILEAGNGTVSRELLRDELRTLRGALFETGSSEKESRRRALRERFVEELRSVRKSVLVPVDPLNGEDLYREMSSEELAASMADVLRETDPGRANEEDINPHLSVSAVPFDSLST